MFRVKILKVAQDHIKIMKKNCPTDYERFMRIYRDLQEHPTYGIGTPKRLHGKGKKWSREINKKDRVVYTIDYNIITVEVLSARGHYDDH